MALTALSLKVNKVQCLFMYAHGWWRGRECSGRGGNQDNHQYVSLSCTIIAEIHRYECHLFCSTDDREHSCCVLCLLKLLTSITSYISGLWTQHKYKCTVSPYALCMSLHLSCGGLSKCSLCSQCVPVLMHAYICMKAYVCLRLQARFSNLVLTDLMRVESWWPCGVSLVPDANHAAGLTQIMATFTLLAANIPALLHVSYPRHQHREDTQAYVACQ